MELETPPLRRKPQSPWICVEHKAMRDSSSGISDVTRSVLLTLHLEPEKWFLLAARLSELRGWWLCVFTLSGKRDVSLCQEDAHSLAHSLTGTLLLWCPVPEHIKQASLLSCWKLGHWGPLNVPKYSCYLLSTVYFVENSSSVLCARCQFSLPCKKMRELGKFKLKKKKQTLCKTREKKTERKVLLL